MISWKFLIFRNSRFSSKHPEINDPSTKIPGNLGHRKIKKCKNIGVSRNSRDKIQIFPGKFLSKFRVFMKIWGRHFHEFPGILVVRTLETARIYGFLGMRAPKCRENSKFWWKFPGKNLDFGSRILGNPYIPAFFGVVSTKIPGNS